MPVQRQLETSPAPLQTKVHALALGSADGRLTTGELGRSPVEPRDDDPFA